MHEIDETNGNIREIQRLRGLLAQAEADAAWWHATAANYVTSATVADRELWRDTMSEALLGEHPGDALLAERDTLYADLERWRAANARQREIHDILYQALKQIDHHIVGAYEVAHSNQPEPCDECIEMREIAEQALDQYRRAMQAQAPGKEPSQ